MKSYLRNKWYTFTLFMLYLAAAAFMTSGCATPAPHSVIELKDEQTQVKGRALDGSITLNAKNQVQVENSRTVEFELQVQDLQNSHLQDEINSELFNLRACRSTMADPALGGTGEVAAFPDIETGRVGHDGSEEVGLSKEGDLKIVTKQFLDERLAAERKYAADMRAKIKAVKPMREECERKLGYKKREVADVK